MEKFTGRTGLVQGVWQSHIGRADLLLAGGMIFIDADRDDPSNALFADDNGARDYRLWVGNLQKGVQAFSKPLKLTLSVFHNGKNYSSAGYDNFTAFHRDETEGRVLSVRLGEVKNPGDWSIGYSYAHIETLAVHGSYAQDDWIRWGSPSQTRASNFKGSELCAALGLDHNMNLLARLYIIEGIKPRRRGESKEDGSRFRFDFNWKF